MPPTPNVDLLHQVLDLIEQHGLSVVLLVSIIFLNIMLFRWLGKKVDQMWKIVMRGLPDPKKETVEIAVVLNSKIRACLQSMQAEMRCDWAQLWQFHNGTHGIGRPRIPFMYLSLTHEITSSGVQEMRHEFTQLPLALFTTFASELISNDIVIHPGSASTPKNARMGEIIRGFGAKIGIMRAIRDDDGNVIAFLAADYNETKTITDHHKQTFLNYAMRMAAILANKD